MDIEEDNWFIKYVVMPLFFVWGITGALLVLYWLVFLVLDFLPNFVDAMATPIARLAGRFAWYVFYPAHYFFLAGLFLLCMIFLFRVVRNTDLNRADRHWSVVLLCLGKFAILTLFFGILYLHQGSLRFATIEKNLAPFISELGTQSQSIRDAGFASTDRTEKLPSEFLSTPFVVVHENPLGTFRLDSAYLPPQFPIAESPEAVRGIIYILSREERGQTERGDYATDSRTCFVIDATVKPYKVLAKGHFKRSAVVGYGAPRSQPIPPSPDGKVQKWIRDALNSKTEGY